ncbi:glutathione S-transferase, putative [Talaromyces stipitatus ATCC 10500]|uniref:Glutathione S-transferase, putative n=1 Tax=Talaromyces stipitatus (strain ATCC 10500 / CBS 375.48 / QM 6759 / NRRL 1006) TaxID=441959 RepID=B8M3T3_TALSN|nr:glutathione S-transferase, putative [Talaromyces stipitatus ATCC 10500]EED20676.1 glutathione S-transferase, putative [Talaromyces stipitatus ATCC 10500]
MVDSQKLPPPILHHLSSSQSLRILWALEELSLSSGLEYNLKCYKRQNARAPAELKTVFPLGRSPILEVPGTIVTESRLILQFLSDKYSNGEWIPETDEDKDRDTYFQEFAIATLNGILNSILYFQIIPPNSPWLVRPLMYAIFNPIVKIFSQDIDPHFSLMERALSDEKPWFSGAKIGLADINLSWPMDSAKQRGYLDEKKYPKLADWLRRVHERPAYQNALKKGGSYDLVKFDM